MKRDLILLGVLLLLALPGFGACAGQASPATAQPQAASHTVQPDGQGSPTAAQGGILADTAGLLDSLRAAGVTVEPAGEVEQAFFSVKGQVFRVNGEDMQVFEYADEAAAEAEAATVSPDGTAIGTSMVTWIAPPHFYRRDKLIVLHLGNNPAVAGALEALLGAQFAGSPAPSQ